MTDPVALSRDAGVGRITLDRPDNLNTLTSGVLAGIRDAVTACEEEGLRTITIRGRGERAFSTGAEIDVLAELPDENAAREFARSGQRTMARLERSPLPIVAAIDGYCLGGGLELASACDVRVATKRSEFGLPEPAIGLLPGWGGTQRLPRLLGESRAREILLSGERYDADTIAEYGFLSRVVPNSELAAATEEWTDRFVNGPPAAYAGIKDALRAGRGGLRGGLEAEARLFGTVRDTGDAEEGLAAFLANREPSFGERDS